MSKVKIDLSVGTNFKTLIEGESSIADAYVVCVQADAVETKVNSAKAAVFGTLRHDMVQIFSRALTEAGDDFAKLDKDKVIGEFLNHVKEQTKDFILPTGADDKTFRQYVSDLKGAVDSGLNLYEYRTDGRSKINSEAKKLRDAEQERIDNERAQNAANDSGKVDESKADNNKSSSSSADPADNGNTDSGKDNGSSNDSVGDSKGGTPNGDLPPEVAFAPEGNSFFFRPKNMSEEQARLLSEMFLLLDDVVQANPRKAQNILDSFTGQVSGAHQKAAKTLTALKKVS